MAVGTDLKIGTGSEGGVLGDGQTSKVTLDRLLLHAQLPQNIGSIENPDGKAVGIGSCGDTLEVGIRLKGDRVVQVGYIPKGCRYTIACASAMSALARGKALDEALQLTPEDVEKELGGLPEDHRHCARLAINTLGEAIADAYRLMTQSDKTET